jgi:hypothetical protein
MAGIRPPCLGRDFSAISFLVTRATKIMQFPLVLQTAVINVRALGYLIHKTLLRKVPTFFFVVTCPGGRVDLFFVVSNESVHDFDFCQQHLVTHQRPTHTTPPFRSPYTPATSELETYIAIGIENVDDLPGGNANIRHIPRMALDYLTIPGMHAGACLHLIRIYIDLNVYFINFG